MKKWKIAGINFDHMHMGDNLRMAFNHPDAEIVGICDEQPNRMAQAIQNFNIPADRVFTDYRRCMETAKPDLVILCPATARHGEWVDRVAPFGVHMIVEKPFAASLAEADRMAAAVQKTGKVLAINWPLVWSAPHETAKRLIDEGRLGDILEVHYHGGNRGPLRHGADKVEYDEATMLRAKQTTWFYSREQGGGSMLDYLGYGTTLGTWYHRGEKPIDVTAVVDQPEGLEVDEQSVTVARYWRGLSKFETRWGTFTDPWIMQPQPKCGFVIVGMEGTVSTYDYEPTVRLQTRQHPEGETIAVDVLRPPFQNPIQYVIHCIETGRPIEGPLSQPISRIGQQIVDSAVLSAKERRTVPLVG
ncbi:MAG: Gfo/Idh/MocA family oxidoreductase [Phycisphaerales bacterium]|nr:Gfo/Idh/MocA family oxidoreductase [Phycisphaerales bacterium]